MMERPIIIGRPIGWIEFPGYADGMPIPRKPVQGDINGC